MAPARYDGLADWYVAYIEGGESVYSRDAARLVGALLGSASGRCLDIGCGTGALVAPLTERGWNDYEATLREAARVLRPGGRYARVGLHPCFAGHFSTVEPEGRLLRPGYFETGLSHAGREEGVRVRAGAWHLPLAVLLNAVIDAGLEPERFEESIGDPPMLLGFGARRAQ